MADKNTKVYHISKRASDGKWAIKFAGGEKAIKLFDTKQEAMAYGTKTESSWSTPPRAPRPGRFRSRKAPGRT